ncbi:MAG: hypothetical protein R3B84_19995 [Zavarzinella sp.]
MNLPTMIWLIGGGTIFLVITWRLVRIRKRTSNRSVHRQEFGLTAAVTMMVLASMIVKMIDLYPNLTIIDVVALFAVSGLAIFFLYQSILPRAKSAS